MVAASHEKKSPGAAPGAGLRWSEIDFDKNLITLPADYRGARGLSGLPAGDCVQKR
jgi:hypothetical protein